MDIEKIAEFVKTNAEALPASEPYGVRYRVSATLTDGTFLPCVVVQSSKKLVDLAKRRFEQERKSGIKAILGNSGNYDRIVETFVASGNRMNHYDIASLGISRFSIPLARLREVGGETSMSWTEFYGTMSDGVEFRFGTSFLTEFFDMPEGYCACDLQKIIPAIRHEKPRADIIYREKPFFTCFIDPL